tara:strand:+ start:2017 stop:5118 length:3102 start_codon:yes stop_codon:yes gene_type:complete
MKKTILMMLLLAFMLQNAWAQTKPISGIVSDARGELLVGVTVVIKGTTTGTVTNESGEYSISAKNGDVLVFRFIGMSTQEVEVGEQNSIDVIMASSNVALEEVVAVGYGVKKRATITGSVASVNNDEIITTKNENVVNMLSGKVSGVRIRQFSSEPGLFNSSIDIRGFGAPLVIIDGVPRDNMARLDPEDIENISVIKDASAAVYGSRAANGVVIITTKKGTETGPAELNYSGNMSWQMPSNYPDLVDAPDWMTLSNEKQKHNVDQSDIIPRYSQEEIESWRNGTNISTNWKDEVMRNSAPQTAHTLSVRGGNDAVTYYSSIGYQYQGSFLQTDAINYEKYNIRSNISAKITDNIHFDLNLSGLMDERGSSTFGSGNIVRSMWLHRPMDKVYYDEESEKYQMMDWNVIENPVAMMDRDLVGENTNKSKWLQSTMSITYDVPFVKGLSVAPMFSYDYTMNDDKNYSKRFTLYLPTGVEYNLNNQASGNSRVNRYFYGKTSTLWQFKLAYERQFGDHAVSAMNLFENSHYEGDNFNASRYLVLPLSELFAGMSENQEAGQSTDSAVLYDFANQASVGRISYDYKGKYLAEFSYRYEGSSKFPENSRWGFFPSVSAGWRVSEESFWKNSTLNFINSLKFRASYGKTGDDGALAYQFINGYQYPGPGDPNALPAGYNFGDSFVSSSVSTGLANKAITWFEAKTLNIGIDAIAWNGLLGATVEYFNRDRSGLLATRVASLPGIVGANLPQENLNSDQTQGFELELSHVNRVGDFNYQVRGNFSFTRLKTKYYEMAEMGNSYQNWRGGLNNRYNDMWWGYEGNGRIENWDEIYYNPIFVGRGTLPGDYEYLDWNGDGRIDDYDVHPIANVGQVPLINYGLTLSGQWKGLDVTMVWQGSGRKYLAPQEFLYEPLWAGTNAISDFVDRWHPADPTADPYNPAIDWLTGDHGYTGSNPIPSSEFNVQDASYLRLKSLEIGYNLPKNILSTVNLKNVRFYISTYNLLTFTKLKYMDPEFNTDGFYGYQYPINKSVTMGLNVKF